MSLLDYSFESNPLLFPLHALFFTPMDAKIAGNYIG